MIASPIGAYMKNMVHLSGCAQRQMSFWTCSVTLRALTRKSFCLSYGNLKPEYSEISVSKTNNSSSVMGFQAFQGRCFSPSISNRRSNLHISICRSIFTSSFPLKRRLGKSLRSKHESFRSLGPKQGTTPKITQSSSWVQRCLRGCLVFGLLVSYSMFQPRHAEALQARKRNDEVCDSSSVGHSHGKQVYTDYSIIGIPGDGRCMFRSVAHGACVRSGKPAPSERVQKELADELRASVADEFVKRRKETEWFIEGDFDAYVSQIRKPHVWGGEPELLMASHVLEMPITVFMYDKDSNGLISIAEYGQEYGKENPIKVLYHGSGHYDALQFPDKDGARSRL